MGFFFQVPPSKEVLGMYCVDLGWVRLGRVVGRLDGRLCGMAGDVVVVESGNQETEQVKGGCYAWAQDNYVGSLWRGWEVDLCMVNEQVLVLLQHPGFVEGYCACVSAVVGRKY